MPALSRSSAVREKSQFAERTSFAPRPPGKPVRIIHIISDLSIGGAEMMLHKLLAKSDRRCFEPIVISLIDRGALRERIESLGIPVRTISMKPGMPSPSGLWRLVRLMRQLKPDLVVGWMYHSCLAAQLANFFLAPQRYVIWSIHDSISCLAWEKRLTKAVIRVCAVLSKLAAHIVFVSQTSRAQHRAFGYHVNNSCVIPNGINVGEFVPSAKARSALRAELGVGEDAYLIGLMGRYHPLKDHANFLQASALLARKHPETHFVLVGRGIDYKNPLLCQSIQDLGLERQTHLLGERHDMPRLAAALDVFSLSSFGESFPNVIGEAMACEVPCVVTNVGDAGLIVGDTGRIVPPRSPQALAAAWNEMINIGPSARIALGQAARTRVIEHFALESVVARYEALYETVLATEVAENVTLAAPSMASVRTLTATFDDSAVQ
ncbi:MAG TPA: glycosyltransferase [Pyrinomonadaceae bacterium]